MAAIIPQVITPEKATGALAIDRTTLFNGLDGFAADQLTRTTSAGNRRTFTVSTWLKFTKLMKVSGLVLITSTTNSVWWKI